jgi:hypothetical protein
MQGAPPGHVPKENHCRLRLPGQRIYSRRVVERESRPASLQYLERLEEMSDFVTRLLGVVNGYLA